jgi:hypothetical protein
MKMHIVMKSEKRLRAMMHDGNCVDSGITRIYVASTNISLT